MVYSYKEGKKMIKTLICPLFLMNGLKKEANTQKLLISSKKNKEVPNRFFDSIVLLSVEQLPTSIFYKKMGFVYNSKIKGVLQGL